MPDNVLKMTETSFVMRLQLTEKSYIDVTVTGTGLSYDRETGMIIGGDVDDIALNSFTTNGRKASLVDVQKVSGINLESAKLADYFGDKFWNNARLMVDKFDALHGVNDRTVYSYFSATENFTKASDYDDLVRGSKFNDRIEGNGGDDDLFGGAGLDRLYGGLGDDLLDGGAQNDFLFDTEGNNQLYGGAGNDMMRGGTGIDILSGGKGNDIIHGGGGFDLVTGGKGRDSFVFDLKEPGKLTITDFKADDVLVNINAGSAEEAQKIFMEYARQDGKNVIFDYGDMHLVLKNYQLSRLELQHFSDGSGIADTGLI